MRRFRRTPGDQVPNPESSLPQAVISSGVTLGPVVEGLGLWNWMLPRQVARLNNIGHRENQPSWATYLAFCLSSFALACRPLGQRKSRFRRPVFLEGQKPKSSPDPPQAVTSFGGVLGPVVEGLALWSSMSPPPGTALHAERPLARHRVGTRYLTSPFGVPSEFIPISLIPNLSLGGGELCCSASTVLTRKKTPPIWSVRAVPQISREFGAQTGEREPSEPLVVPTCCTQK